MESGKSLAGKVAWVTGGAKGIGRACALAFAEAGADIAIADIADMSATAQAIKARGRRVFTRHADMGSPKQIAHFAQAALAALGPPDILLNNAGLNLREPFGRITEDSFDRVMAVHLKGMVFMAQEAWAPMIGQGGGRVINVASQLAFKGAPGIVAYCAAKAGIVGFTRALAREAAPHGILVNAIAPGPVETDLTASRGPEWRQEVEASLPLRRLGRAEEMAATALLLAGPGGAFYCGATLSPNGGDVMH